MAPESLKTLNLDDQTLMLLHGNLKRIFALKVTRSTLREVQNVLLTCTKQDQEIASTLFESLLKGSLPQINNEHQKETLEEIVKEFMIPLRLAKEVFERGEFINLITSDLMHNQDRFAFLNHFRRIDGKEFSVMTDTPNTLHVIGHFITRLNELTSHPKGKELLSGYKKEIKLLADKLKELA